MIFRRNHSPFSVDLSGLYRGAVFLVSAGPSLKLVDTSQLRRPGVVTFGVNNSPKLFRPNLWASMDTPSRFLESIWLDPLITKFVGEGKANDFISRKFENNEWRYFGPKVGECPNVIYIKRNETFHHDTFLTEPHVNWGCSRWTGGGRTVMLAVFKIAYLLGFRRLYLVGVDWSMTPDRLYAFKEQRSSAAVRNNHITYLRTIEALTAAQWHFREHGFQVFNCSPGSELSIYPFVPLTEAVARETASFPPIEAEETYGRYLPNEPKAVEKVLLQNKEGNNA